MSKRPRQTKSKDTKRYQQTNLALWKLDESEETFEQAYSRWKNGPIYKHNTLNLFNRVLKIGNTIEEWMVYWEDTSVPMLLLSDTVFERVIERLEELEEEWLLLDDKITPVKHSFHGRV